MKLTENEYDGIRAELLKHCGVTLGTNKQYLVTSRLEPILTKHAMSSYTELLERLKLPSSRLLQEELVHAMTTKETSFNRDAHPFAELTRSILPYLVESQWRSRRGAGYLAPRLRIWSAAASTGQEAYSVGMSVMDYLDDAKNKSRNQSSASEIPGPENFSILGTDVSSPALDIAKLGSYRSFDIERGLNDAQKQKYFIANGDIWQVTPQLKRMVEFRVLNLVRPLGDLGSFEMILCRNVLIYFEESTRREILRQMVERLTIGGLLMLGATESLPVRMPELQQVWAGQTVYYRKHSAKPN